jgi:endogenous inhibitor of DNA gyrase (YacG/DUF329 family)
LAFDFYTVQQAIVGSSAAGNRAGLTLLGMSIAGHYGFVDFPPGIDFLTSLPGIAGLFGLTIVEELTERDEDMQDILEYINYGTKGLAGAFAIWSVDLMPVGTPPWLAMPLGFVVAGATHHYRMKLHATLRGMGDHWLSPRTYVVALETGGALALVVLLALAPILAMLLLVMFLMAGGVYLASRWAIERQVMRHPCPQCGKRIRKEASVCHHCSKPLDISRWLAKAPENDGDDIAAVPSGVVLDASYAAASSEPS